jgi:hypothetical protein
MSRYQKNKNTLKDKTPLQEIAEILAAGINRMKKKGKLKQ